jgi:homoserine O-succinyltransferase/O-acetyltransferase
MALKEKKIIRIAILDLYQGMANEGMRCIRDIIKLFATKNKVEVVTDEFEVRLKSQVPDMSYDIFISTGGPGSPLDSEGSDWEKAYFTWLQQVLDWNTTAKPKKHSFFICHSFQLACRHFAIGNVCKRKSTAFGVFPIHLLTDGKNEPVFKGMTDPFYAVDSRDYQVIQPNAETFWKTPATVLAIEKDRPHVPLERAIMAVRFNKYMIGTQFHPEADAVGMSMYLQMEEKKQTVIENYGEEKWQSMIEQLNDPDKIRLTNAHLLPNFLKIAVENG